jgi:hypothetical protein
MNFPESIRVCSTPARFKYCSSNGAITDDLWRNAHQELAEILASQETDEGPRRVLKSLYHVFAIFDSSLADPGRDIAHEIPITRRKIGDDETTERVLNLLLALLPVHSAFLGNPNV